MSETAGLDLVDVILTGLAAPSRWAASTVDGRPVDIPDAHPPRKQIFRRTLLKKLVKSARGSVYLVEVRAI